MKRRIYSSKFIDSKIATIDKLHKENQQQYPEWPDYTDKPWLAKQIKELIKHNRNLVRVAAFWEGYTLAMGIDWEKEEKDLTKNLKTR